MLSNNNIHLIATAQRRRERPRTKAIAAMHEPYNGPSEVRRWAIAERMVGAAEHALRERG